VLVVHAHLTLQNCVGAICRGLPAHPAVCSAMRAVTIPALLIGTLVLRRYRARAASPRAPRMHWRTTRSPCMWGTSSC